MTKIVSIFPRATVFSNVYPNRAGSWLEDSAVKLRQVALSLIAAHVGSSAPATLSRTSLTLAELIQQAANAQISAVSRIQKHALIR
jgi:hypothetical protein